MKTKTLYTKEKDGTIQKWYLWGWVGGNRIAVSTVKMQNLQIVSDIMI